MTVTVERALARHVAEALGSPLAAATAHAARRELLWAIGTAQAGAGAPGSESLRDYAAGFSGSPATVLGCGSVAHHQAAAFLNAVAAKAHEFEDKYWLDGSHGYAIGSVVVPAALAIAEREGADSDALLTAIAVATDVQARLVRGVLNASFATTGWNSTYVFSSFGAAVAASVLMGLDEEACAMALGLAFVQASGNFQSQIEGVMGARLQAGFAARDGITAADLAARGISAPAQWLTGRYGLYHLHFRDLDTDADRVGQRLGEEWLGERLGYKAYPCGVVAHPVLDLLRDLSAGIDAADVAEVVIRGNEKLEIMTVPLPGADRCAPSSHIEAQFSLPWGIACVLRDGDLTLAHYEQDAIDDEGYRALARRVTTQLATGRTGVELELTLRDGSVRKGRNDGVARGHPDNPLSTEDLIRGYLRCCDHAPAPSARAAAHAIPPLIFSGETFTLSSLTRLLRGKAESAALESDREGRRPDRDGGGE